MAARWPGARLHPAAATLIPIPMKTEDDKSREEDIGSSDCETGLTQPEGSIREPGGRVGSPPGGTVQAATETALYRRLVAEENAPLITNRDWLKRCGLRFHASDKLHGKELTEELWRLIRALAKARVFFEHSDHLSNPELYGRLWREVLEAEEPDIPRTEAMAWHWDLAEAGGDHESEWLTYYADDCEREEWQEMFPETTMPEHRDPPYERDALLPKWQ